MKKLILTLSLGTAIVSYGAREVAKNEGISFPTNACLIEGKPYCLGDVPPGLKGALRSFVEVKASLVLFQDQPIGMNLQGIAYPEQSLIVVSLKSEDLKKTAIHEMLHLEFERLPNEKKKEFKRLLSKLFSPAFSVNFPRVIAGLPEGEFNEFKEFLRRKGEEWLIKQAEFFRTLSQNLWLAANSVGERGASEVFATMGERGIPPAFKDFYEDILTEGYISNILNHGGLTEEDIERLEGPLLEVRYGEFASRSKLKE